MPSLSHRKIQDYLISLVPSREPEMAAMERLAAKTGFPIIGPAAGHFCYQIARQIGAKSVFELGSGFGYSTAWFARAVKENGGGVIHHTVWDAKLSGQARGHLSRMGLGGIVTYHIAEAMQTLRAQQAGFDVIFNDIEKHDYPASLPLIKEKLRPGGVLIVDNTLWGGRIFEGHDRSADTRGVRQFTKAITSDPDWIVSLVPVRDGMIMAYKKPR